MKIKLISAILSVSLLSTMMNFTVLAEGQNTAETRVIYSENFDNKGTTEGLFTKVPFWSFMDDSYVVSNYELKTATYGKADTDKSLHLKETFKHPYGKKTDGTTVLADAADNTDIVAGGNSGISHRVMSNEEKITGTEKYIHVSFSAAQDGVPTEINGAKGAVLDVSFNLLTTGGGTYRERKFLTWYSNERQGCGWGENMSYYQVPEYAGKWVKYDYVFDTQNNTLDIYTNGYKVVSREHLDWDYPAIQGIKQIDFQTKDVNTGAAERDVNVYLDDIEVSYDKTAPVITTYSTFGEAAKLNNVPEQYVNSETGIVYNYGQTLSDMAGYINGSEGTKTVYLVTEKSGNSVGTRKATIDFEKYESQSLNTRTLEDRREVNPILFVEDGGFTYRYEVRQPLATTIKPVISDFGENGVTINWSGQSENCQGVEIFRDGEKIDTAEASATSYVDATAAANMIYSYTIREILSDNNVSAFSDMVRNIYGPENFTAAQVSQETSVKLTWEAPKGGTVASYEIYRNGALLTTVEADATEYTDNSVKEDHTYRYSVAAVFSDGESEYKSDKVSEIAVQVKIGESKYRVMYIQDFDDSETTEGLFDRVPFWSFMDESYVSSEYELQTAAYGKADTDKSLNLKETFKHPYGKKTDGTTDLANAADNAAIVAGGNSGVSHRVMSNDEKMTETEKYIHVSFSAVQDGMPEAIDGEKGAALDVSFDLLTTGGGTYREKGYLHWYSNGYQGFNDAHPIKYKVPMSCDKWVKYDYVFNTVTETLDVYVNGHRIVEGNDQRGWYPQLQGIHQLNFQVRDVNTGSSEREVNVCIDDIKVTYNETAPVVSAYTAYGDAAKINVPAPYANNAEGIIYNYGQTLSDMAGYINGDGENIKNVYLVTESDESTTGNITYEKKETGTLNLIKLNDNREVNPTLYVEDGLFTYCYEIRQPLATAIKPVISAFDENGVTINWSGQSENCQSIEIFRNGEKIGTSEADATSYVDTTADSNTIYNYTIREILPDNNVSAFSDMVRNIYGPENFAAAQVLQEKSVKLTWEAPKGGTPAGYEIYRNGALLTTVGADATEYTDNSVKADHTYRYSVAAVFGAGESEYKSDKALEKSVQIKIGESKYRVMYIQDFDDNETTEGLFDRVPFWSFMDESYVSSEYELKTAAYGKSDTDKSLNLKETFKHPYGKKTDGTTDLANAADNDAIEAGGNSGVSHRVMSNDEQMTEAERYLHISFSAAQDGVPAEIDGEKGAVLNVSFDLLTANGNRERKFLTWYSNERQGCGFGENMSYYQVPAYAGKWVKYDYVFDTQENTLDIYTNGYKVVSRTNLDWDYPAIKGLHQLNFQVRDVNKDGSERDVNVCVDDIRVTYNETAPVISTYTAFGDAAMLNIPAPYANNADGIIYNYGQSMTDITDYINGNEGTKNVYLVTEKSGNIIGTRKATIDFEKYESESLNIRKLDDGREVNPFVYVEDGGFTYRYEVRQPLATTIKPVISDFGENGVTINWSGQSDNCQSIEIFRDGEKIDTAEASATSYVDATAAANMIYSYTIREILSDNNVSAFSDMVRNIYGPENFTAAQVSQETSVKLTWEAPKGGTVTGYEIYRNGALLTTAEADATEYTDNSVKANNIYRYSIVAVFGEGESEYKSDKADEIAVQISVGEAKYRVMYIQDFDDSETTDGLFDRVPFWSFMDDSYVSSEYELKTAAYGKADTDKSLNLKETFKHPYGKKTDDTDLANTADNTFIEAGGNSGVSHRVMSNDEQMTEDERYLHISFSAAQDGVPAEIDGEKGAVLNVSFELLTEAGNRERKFLTWYSNERQGCGVGENMSYYQIPEYAGKWVKYDYVFDTQDNTLDIYTNGYKVVSRTNLDWDYPAIKGLHQLNFQVRDINTDDTEREVNVCVDDIKVTYNETAPEISAYAVFGDAAKISAPEKYVDASTGIIYNYGQTLSDMAGYINGSEGTKNVYLVTEKSGNIAGTRKATIDFEKYESESLNIRKLDDGREVNPILYVEDGGFTYCYEIVQAVSYNTETKTVTIKSEKDYDEEVAVIIAGYQGGHLIACDVQNISLKAGDNLVSSGEEFDISNADDIKVMVWDSINTLKPLYNAFQFILK